jgi:glycosyltransferase involved in cell wall biosynthesis
VAPIRPIAVVPAFEAEGRVAGVVESLRAVHPFSGEDDGVLVVDDGSRDRTAERAERAGALVVRHAVNLGKGAAIRTGLRAAARLGADVAVTVDADGQHPAEEAARLALLDSGSSALVIGVRDLSLEHAPRANRASNAISNFFVSLFAGRSLADTQCGLRRYPVRATLALGVRDDGYGFEAEVLLRGVGAGMPVVQVPVRVRYDLPDRTTHFRVVRDPVRIVARVLATASSGRRSG